MKLLSPTITQAKDKIVESVLPVLWEQWQSIGVSTHVEQSLDYTIDPEALILFSSEFARYDGRLFQEMLDWLHINGKSINIQRLLNIRKAYPLGNAQVMRSIAQILTEYSSSFNKWKKITTHKEFTTDFDTATDKAKEPLFHSQSNLAIPVNIEDCEPSFLRYGLVTSAFELRQHSKTPKSSSSPNLVFKLRSLFGCNSKAEILAWLLTHPSGHPAQIANEVHYFNKSVQDTLNQMSASGLVSSRRTEREKHFSLDHAHWNTFLTNDKTDWHHWAARFATVSIFTETLTNAIKMEASDILAASMLQQKSQEKRFSQEFVNLSSTEPVNYLDTVLTLLEHTMKP